MVDFDPSALLTTLHGLAAAGGCDTSGAGRRSMLSRTTGLEAAAEARAVNGVALDRSDL